MRSGRYSIEAILGILAEVEQGSVSITAVCQEHQISRMTYYRWKKRYEDTLLAATLRMKKLEKETGLLGRHVGKKVSIQRNGSEERPTLDSLYESACMTVLLEENARLKRMVIEQALDIQRFRETSFKEG